MSPCSAKIASASARNASQPSRSPSGPKPAVAARNGPGLLAEHLHAPEVDLLQLVELRRQALEVEHDVVRVLGDRWGLEHDRAVLAQGAGAGEDALGLRLADLHPPLAPGALELGEALRRRSARGAGRSSRCRGARARAARPRSTPADEPDRALAPPPAASSARSSRSPSTSTSRRCSGGSVAARPEAEDLARASRARRRLPRRGRRGSRRRRCGPGARPAARRRSARRASRRARAGARSRGGELPTLRASFESRIA